MKKTKVYVIESNSNSEEDLNIIGVASSREKAISLVKEYYGTTERSSFQDIRDSGLDCTFTIEWKWKGHSHTDTIVIRDFIIDSL